MIIRQAISKDAQALAPLFKGLGYPLSAEEIEKKIDTYSSEPSRYGLLVAEIEGKVIGFVGYTFHEFLILPAYRCRIEGLFVDPDYRGRGIARTLLEHLEQEAKNRGCTSMELTSGARRAKDGTHIFYEKLGYSNTGPDAKVFLKKKL